MSLLASMRAASTMPAPWEVADEPASPMLLPHGGLSPSLSASAESPVAVAPERPPWSRASTMELPVSVVQDVPSADGSAIEPCARSDDAAAAAKVASRAQTEHAEHLQALLRALQLPRGAVVPTPTPQRDGAAAGGAAAPQLDSLLDSLKQCRTSLDEQQQRCTAEAKATLEVPVPVPPRWSSSADAGASSGASSSGGASGGASSREHALGGELGLGGETGAAAEARPEEAQDAVSLLEASFPAHLAQLFASESAALREMALGRLGSLLLSSDSGEAPAEAEVWEAGADEAAAAAAAAADEEEEEEEEEGAAAPRFWARATLLSEDCEALGAGCTEAGSEPGGEVPQTPPHAEPRARSSPDARLLAACMAVREALLDDELRVRSPPPLAAWHCCSFPPAPVPTAPPIPPPSPAAATTAAAVAVAGAPGCARPARPSRRAALRAASVLRLARGARGAAATAEPAARPSREPLGPRGAKCGRRAPRARAAPLGRGGAAAAAPAATAAAARERARLRGQAAPHRRAPPRHPARRRRRRAHGGRARGDGAALPRASRDRARHPRSAPIGRAAALSRAAAATRADGERGATALRPGATRRGRTGAPGRSRPAAAAAAARWRPALCGAVALAAATATGAAGGPRAQAARPLGLVALVEAARVVSSLARHPPARQQLARRPAAAEDGRCLIEKSGCDLEKTRGADKR